MSAVPESGPMGLDPLRKGASRVRFDPTINLGHILTFVSAMVASLSAVLMAWTDLRAKDVVHDQRLQAIESKALYEEARSRETLREMRDDIREVRRGIEQMQRMPPRTP